jgi:glycosyltransferase involved in cell wall biosynthesis
MKISILNKATIWGGAEVHTVGFVKALLERGHAASIVCLDEETRSLYQSTTNGAIPLLSLKTSKPVNKRNVLDWLLALRGLSSDAAVYGKGTLYAGNLALELASRLHFRRFVTIEHLEPPELPAKTSRSYLGGTFPGVGLWWYRWVLSGYLRSISPHKVIVVSDAVRNQLTRDYHFPGRKVLTVHNGTDLARFRPDSGDRQQMRRQWGFSDDTVVFGSIRRLISEKGLDVAIEAFATLVKKLPGCELAMVLVGEGPERSSLERLAEQRGVSDRVIFTGLILEAWRAYTAFDVFLIPSRRESLGIAVLEAMASGCCCIASAVGGLCEVLSLPGLGWLVPPDNAPALAQAMEEVLQTESKEKARITERAREHVMTNFNNRVQFARIAEIIEGLPG